MLNYNNYYKLNIRVYLCRYIIQYNDYFKALARNYQRSRLQVYDVKYTRGEWKDNAQQLYPQYIQINYSTFKKYLKVFYRNKKNENNNLS